MHNTIEEYVMKREEVPECWLRPEDIIGHAIDELLKEEIEYDECTSAWS